MLTSLISGERALVAALIVFIAFTVLLALFIVLLFLSKKARSFFFEHTDKPKKQKAANRKAAKKPAQKQSGNAKKPAKKEAKSDYLAYVDSVPTVPLGGFDPPPANGKQDNIMKNTTAALKSFGIKEDKKPEKKTLDSVPTVKIAAAESSARSTAAKPAAAKPASATKPVATVKPAARTTASDKDKGKK